MDELIRQLGNLAIRKHDHCEDFYYSCPMSDTIPDHFRDDEPVCNCGADEHNALVRSLLEQIKNANG
jgi:hypothetical protein